MFGKRKKLAFWSREQAASDIYDSPEAWFSSGVGVYHFLHVDFSMLETKVGCFFAFTCFFVLLAVTPKLWTSSRERHKTQKDFLPRLQPLVNQYKSMELL